MTDTAAPNANEGAQSHWERALPYALICLVGLFCHGLILTNDGTIWDGWWAYNWVKTRNWTAFQELMSAGGTPLYYWLYRPFAMFPNIMAAFMLAIFLSMLAGSILTYRLILKLSRLSRGEALAITLLALAMPTFTAAQEMMLFYYTLSCAIFLGSAWLAAQLLETAGWQHWLLRGLALAGFLLSFANASLIVYYGGFYVALYLYYLRVRGLTGKTGVQPFLKTYPDLFLLPVVGWISRKYLTPQHGWYANYNDPARNLENLEPNLTSFFTNVLPSHVGRVLGWPIEHPVLALGLLGLVFAWYRWSPARLEVAPGPERTWPIVGFGAFLLFCGVLPFAAAGKAFPELPQGESSRHCLLTPLPLAILLFGALRCAVFWKGSWGRRLLAPVVGGAVVVLGSHIPPVYVHEQAEWIYSKAIMRACVKDEVVRNSAMVALDSYSVFEQETYGIFGLATAFGETTRYATKIAPDNRSFFTPSELLTKLHLTTVLPGTYRGINPAGMQTLLIADRQQGSWSEWDLVSRHRSLRYFGTEQELDDFLSKIIAFDTQIIKKAVPMVPAANPPAAEDSSAGAAGFTNSLGIRMVPLPGGWWAAKYETMQADYERVMSSNPSLFKDPWRPVECVSWEEAMEFCRRVQEVESKAGRVPDGLTYRLPTVAEFDQMAAVASYGQAVTSFNGFRWHTAPAGTLPASAYGQHDVLGNVWEWCLDWSDEKHRYKIAKGASWVNLPLDLATEKAGAYKGDWNLTAGAERLLGPVRRDYPDQGFWDRGFRCVLAPKRVFD